MASLPQLDVVLEKLDQVLSGMALLLNSSVRDLGGAGRYESSAGVECFFIGDDVTEGGIEREAEVEDMEVKAVQAPLVRLPLALMRYPFPSCPYGQQSPSQSPCGLWPI